jgi:hypothetical protein
MNQPRMPSPAILVGVLALVAALAGTAVAGPDASTSAITKKTVKKIATKQINQLAPGLSVAHADTADSADTANSANTANTADTANTANTATSANPIAFARVAADANVLEADSKGIGDANVFEGGTDGSYCFRNLGFAFKGAQVTIEALSGNAVTASFADSESTGALGDCGGPTQAQALVFTVDGSSLLEPSGFYIAFYN